MSPHIYSQWKLSVGQSFADHCNQQHWSSKWFYLLSSIFRETGEGVEGVMPTLGHIFLYFSIANVAKTCRTAIFYRLFLENYCVISGIFVKRARGQRELGQFSDSALILGHIFLYFSIANVAKTCRTAIFYRLFL